MSEFSLPSFSVLKQKIRDHYELVSQHIPLGDQAVHIQYPADTDALLDELIARDSQDPDVQDERIPYWADVWPSAIGMTQFLAKNPALIFGKQVLEVGCGLALPCIAAAKLGAGRAIMTDYLEAALEMAAYNWGLNELGEPTVDFLDWRNPPEQLASDVLLASDVIYEDRNLESLLLAFKLLCRPGGLIVWSEPGRPLGETFRKQLSECGFLLKEANEKVVSGKKSYQIRIFLVSPPKDGID